MLRRLMNSIQRKRLEAEIQEEVDFHRGQTPGSFGNVTAIREQMRDASTIVWLETLLQDLRYGLRILSRTPGISAIAILSLALGIGANAAIFSLVDRVILSILPVKQPEQLVLFDYVQHSPICGTKSSAIAVRSFREWLEPPVSLVSYSMEVRIPRIRLRAALSPEITLRSSAFSPLWAARSRMPTIRIRALIPKLSSATRSGRADFTQIQPSSAKPSA